MPEPVPVWSPSLTLPFHPLSFPYTVGPLSPARGSGWALWAPPAGSVADPQPKSNSVHFSFKIWHLVAAILRIFLRSTYQIGSCSLKSIEANQWFEKNFLILMWKNTHFIFVLGDRRHPFIVLHYSRTPLTLLFPHPWNGTTVCIERRHWWYSWSVWIYSHAGGKPTRRQTTGGQTKCVTILLYWATKLRASTEATGVRLIRRQYRKLG